MDYDELLITLDSVITKLTEDRERLKADHSLASDDQFLDWIESTGRDLAFLS